MEKSLVKKKQKNEKFLLISIIAIMIVVDQVCKIWIQNIKQIEVIPGILYFEISQNTKAAYGIGSDSIIMYVLTNLVVLGIIGKFITTQNEFVDQKLKILLSFILAGGISNVIDKITKGYIIEYINLKQVVNLPVFNLADMFVLIGWIAIVARFAVFSVKEWRSKKESTHLRDNDKKEGMK